MKKLGLTFLAAALLSLCLAPSAGAFAFNSLDDTFTNQDGSPATQAGSHPFAQTTTLGFDTIPDPNGGVDIPDGDLKDMTVSLPPGFVGDPTVIPTCSGAEFVNENCPAATQVGFNDVTATGPEQVFHVFVYNLVPPPGIPAKLGFHVVKVPVTIDLKVNEDPPFNVLAVLHNTPNAVTFYHSALSVWGVPASPVHDAERGCASGCNLNLQEKPFLTLPRACEGPLPTSFAAVSSG